MAENRKFVALQIENGTYSLSQSRRKSYSYIWNILVDIIKQDGSVLKGWVYCRTCRSVLKMDGYQTNNLIHHKCCQSFKQLAGLRKVTPSDRQEANNICAKCIIDDCLPFLYMSGLGFMKIAKFCIQIGAALGDSVDVSNFLPDPTTISLDLQKTAEESRKIIFSEIKDIVKNGGATAAIKMWYDNFVKRNFIAVTLHYQKDVKLFDIILGLKLMDSENSAGVNIPNELKTLFNQFGIEDIEPIKFVTYKDINIAKALENNTRLNCSSHLFAYVIEKSFEETTELAEILRSCNQILENLQNNSLQCQLPEDLSPIDCNSNYTILKSIADNWANVNVLLTYTEESNRLDISMLSLLIELCKDFEFVFQKLKDCSSPSLCYVLPSIFKIKSLCTPNTADMPGILVFKKNIAQNIEEIWERNITIWHKAALFLFPPAVNMQRTENDNIKEFCVSQIRNFKTDELTSTLQPQLSLRNPSLCNNRNPPSSPSASCLSVSSSANVDSPKPNVLFFFPNLKNLSSGTTMGSAWDEVERYSKDIVYLTEDFDVMKWWINKAKSYPRLSQFALQIHSIPATIASAEGAFELAGDIITRNWNSLEEKYYDDILFLHSFYENFEQ